jgi:CRISPR-associated protein Cas5d
MTTQFVLRGPLACFSRPESPDRFTYPIPTPCALQQIISAIYGHPGVGSVIRRIHVLNPIQYVQVAHVHAGAVPTPGSKVPESGRPTVETLLRDPAWMIEFDWCREPNHGKWRRTGAAFDIGKVDAIFKRRVARGEFFRTPSLGLHQLRAIFHAPTGRERAIHQSRDFGMVLHSIDYGRRPVVPHVFHAVMVDGVVDVPSLAEVRGKKAA